MKNHNKDAQLVSKRCMIDQKSRRYFYVFSVKYFFKAEITVIYTGKDNKVIRKHLIIISQTPGIAGVCIAYKPI
jgi:hypothetical protein